MLHPKYVENFLSTHDKIISELFFDKCFDKDYLMKSSFKELDSFFDIISYIGKNETSIDNITVRNSNDMVISIILNCSKTVIDIFCDFLVEENICLPDGSNIKTLSKNYISYEKTCFNFRIGRYDKKKDEFTKIFFKTCTFRKIKTFSNIISNELEINKKNICFTISDENDFEEFKKLIFKCKGIYKPSNSEIFIANPVFKKVR